MEARKKDAFYLTCEKYYIFELLIFAAGMMGSYTYNLRGGVFCNAQTANVVLMALAFGHGEWQKGLYYLIPISAYFAGTMVSEALPSGIRHQHFLRWDTWLIGFEILVLFILYNQGQTHGAEAVARGEILYQRQEKGLEITASERRLSYHPLKGYVTALIGMIPAKS